MTLIPHQLGSNGEDLHDINTTSTGIKWEDLHDINTTSTGVKWEDLHDIYMTLTPHQLVVNWDQMGRFTQHLHHI